jgi:hypothetical protein
LRCSHPRLTRRRYLEAREECRHVFYGDVHVGTLTKRVGNVSKDAVTCRAEARAYWRAVCGLVGWVIYITAGRALLFSAAGSWSTGSWGMAAGAGNGAGPMVRGVGPPMMTIYRPGRIAAPGNCFSSAWSAMTSIALESAGRPLPLHRRAYRLPTP